VPEAKQETGNQDAIWPRVIQGGMGVYVSANTLARAVAMAGHIGVISATAIEQIFARKLQMGDPGGHLKRACAAFPDQKLVERVWKRYAAFRAAGEPFRAGASWTAQPKRHLVELTVLAAFSEVWLAKEGHKGLVGANLMQKLQLPTMFYLYGALLAGVDFFLVGAGIPNQFPGLLDTLVDHQSTRLRLSVAPGAHGGGTGHEMVFDPREIMDPPSEPVERPRFLPIVSSHVLAKRLLTNAGRIDGFIVEGPTAGGHNAPPRASGPLNEKGEPIYGQRDVCDLGEMRKLGVPFYLAGGYGNPEGLQSALAEGAAGVQVGTPFALCQESGLSPTLKDELLGYVERDEIDVIASATFSPSGMPFQTARVPGTVALEEVYKERVRICDIGLLVELYEKTDGTLGQRCAAEPEDVFALKGGDPMETDQRRCLCNGLVAAAGFAQVRKWSGEDGIPMEEPPVVTLGKDMVGVRHFLAEGRLHYSAKDVLEYITGERVA